MSRKPRRCAARACEAHVNSGMLMCRDHWLMVPTPLKREVRDAYKARGGYPSAPMTQRYADALVAAVRAVAEIETAQASVGIALDPETLFAHPDDTSNPVHDQYDDTPIGSDQPPNANVYSITIDDPDDDVTEAFDWRKHMKAEFIILEETTHCHLHVVHNQESADKSAITCTMACEPCGILYAQTYEINSCDTCNARGGTISGETQGDGYMTGYLEFFEPCDDCISNGLCPGCSNGTLTAGVYEAAMADIDTFTCEVCGWHFWRERFYPDEPDYDGGIDDYDPRDDQDFEGYPIRF